MRRYTLPLVILGCVALAALLTWLVLSSSLFGGRSRSAAPGPQVRTTTQTLVPFRRLDVSGTAEITLVQGDSESVTLPAYSRRSEYVAAEVRDGTLYVESGDSSRWWDFLLGGRGRRTPQVVVKYRELEAIAAAGTVRLVADTMKAADLRVAAAGGTLIRIEDLTARLLRVSGAGALRADIAGRVKEQNVTISGAGEYRGAKLVSEDATVNVAGAAKVVVNAQKTLKATISGAGTVEYLGDPEVTERVSGVGRVKRLESARTTSSIAVVVPAASSM